MIGWDLAPGLAAVPTAMAGLTMLVRAVRERSRTKAIVATPWEPDPKDVTAAWEKALGIPPWPALWPTWQPEDGTTEVKLPKAPLSPRGQQVQRLHQVIFQNDQHMLRLEALTRKQQQYRTVKWQNQFLDAQAVVQNLTPMMPHGSSAFPMTYGPAHFDGTGQTCHCPTPHIHRAGPSAPYVFSPAPGVRVESYVGTPVQKIRRADGTLAGYFDTTTGKFDPAPKRPAPPKHDPGEWSRV